MPMKWNQTTVPTHVVERHELSLSLGKAFAQSYAIHPLNEQTQQLLEIYVDSRRMVDRPSLESGRYGANNAYEATQGL